MKTLIALILLFCAAIAILNALDQTGSQKETIDRVSLEKEMINQQHIKDKAEAEIRRLERLLNKDLIH